jgi:hypothetical protein
MQPPQPDPKLRFYRVCYPWEWEESEDPDNPSFQSSYEFIGYRVAHDDEDENREWNEPRNSLYQDIGGFLHFCYGYEVEVGSWDVHVLIIGHSWQYGKTREETVAAIRNELEIVAGISNDFDVDAHIPSILKSPPPEVETMHEMTGYDS